MSNMIAVVGPSGSGKSHSIGCLEPKETFLISVSGKKLPMRGFDKKYTAFSKSNIEGNKLNTADPDVIQKTLAYINKNKPEIKTVVIDDAQYLTVFELFDRSSEKGWDKYSEIASHFFDVIKGAMEMRDDLTVVIMFHDEIEESQILQKAVRIIKVGSKAIKEKLIPEGLFTYVFFTEIRFDENGKKSYGFITNSDGTTTAKSPVGCFSKDYIQNDLKYAIEKIYRYNNDEDDDESEMVEEDYNG